MQLWFQCVIVRLLLVLGAPLIQRGQDSSVGITIGLQAGRPGLDSGQVKVFSFLHSLQTGLWGPHSLLFYGYWGHSSPIKRPGCEAEHSPPSSSEVKKVGAIRPLPHMSSWYSA
jgi:hypothetical protein